MAPLAIEPLRLDHLDALAVALLHPAVYQHIEDTLPSLDAFKLSLSRALSGPPAHKADQTWLNYLVRDPDTSDMLGRLEATVHDAIAEVAFLFHPSYWGKGFATAGLHWLHGEIRRTCHVSDFWATTVRANLRCQALLQRCGYVRVTGSTPHLLSYAPGDWVFRCQGGNGTR